MIIDYKDWYNSAYWEGRKQYQTPDGKTEFYHGPALDWSAFDFIADVLASLLPGKTLLDIGCGGGGLAARFLKKGYDAYGVDVSEYARSNCVPEMRSRISLMDITDDPPSEIITNIGKWPNKFDVVMATDLLEHIYAEDLEETFTWILSKAKKYIFFLVAITYGEEFIHKKGKPIPPRWEPTAISGHVHVRTPKFWRNWFLSMGLKIDWEKMYLFQLQRSKNKEWAATGGWDPGSTWILERR